MDNKLKQREVLDMEKYLDGVLARDLIQEIKDKVLVDCEDEDVLFVHIVR
jgi:hypothetical protein